MLTVTPATSPYTVKNAQIAASLLTSCHVQTFYQQAGVGDASFVSTSCHKSANDKLQQA